MITLTEFHVDDNFIVEREHVYYIGRVYEDNTVGIVVCSKVNHTRTDEYHLPAVPKNAKRITHHGVNDNWKLSPLVRLVTHEAEIRSLPIKDVSV